MSENQKEDVANASSFKAKMTHDYYIDLASAPNTRRAYRAAIMQFEAYAGLLPADEHTIAQYMTEKATLLNPRTLSLHLTALSNWHRYYGFPDPTKTLSIRALLNGIQREHGSPKHKARALRAEHITALITKLNDTKQDKQALKAARDSALIQVAFFGAFRRSELIAVHVEHLKFEPEGLLIVIPKSKTDQTGQGKIKALPYGSTEKGVCPVRAMKFWLTLSGITEGLVFRAINRWGQLQEKSLHPDSVNLIIKSIGKKCQFDFINDLSSHSLRRGFATSAARAGAEFGAIKLQGGWENDSTVRDYIEEGRLFDSNAADQLLKFSFNQNEQVNDL